jgi:hypothetical protein
MSVAILPALAANGHDDPGTQITNVVTATYKDANNNTYTTTSNTVTATVQNAPVLTNTPSTGTTYAPGQLVTDSFTLLNAGNAAGYFQLSGDASLGGTDGASATLGNGAATCTTPVGSESSPCLYAANVGSTTYYFTNLSTSNDNNALNYWLEHTNPATAANGSITVNVYYSLSSSAPVGSSNTVTSSVTASVVYVGAGSAPQETSAAQSGTESNRVQSDARLDLFEASSQNTTTGVITYTTYAHNGGAFAAKDLQSAQTLLGASAEGILITTKVPSFNGTTLALANGGAVTTAANLSYGFASGAVASVYYSTSSTGAQGSWVAASGNLPTNGSVTYIGIFIHGGTCTASGYELCVDNAHTTSPGSISVMSAYAVDFSYAVSPPTGPGSGNPGAVTVLANGVIGDNLATEHILGPGISAITADGASSSAITQSGQGINNTALTSVEGASNQTSNQALSGYAAVIGPAGAVASQGSYDGTAAVNTFDDFTAFAFGVSGDNIPNTSTTAGAPSTTAHTSAAITLCAPDELENDGNGADTFNVTAYAPTAFAVSASGGQSYSTSFSAGGAQVGGWSVGIYSDSGCSTPLGGSTPGSTSSTASSLSLMSGANMLLYVKYVIPAGTAYFYRFDSLVHAASIGNPAQLNDTHNELYSSFIALTKTQTITSTNCPSGVSPSYAAGTLCPGDTITYVLDYRNIVMGQSDTNVSFANVIVNAANLNVVDDGTLSSTSSATQNDWGYFTTGLQAVPATRDPDGDTNSDLTFEYATGTPRGTYSGTFAVGATAFEFTLAGSGQLVPRGYNSPSGSQDWAGTVTYTLTVK